MTRKTNQDSLSRFKNVQIFFYSCNQGYIDFPKGEPFNRSYKLNSTEENHKGIQAAAS